MIARGISKNREIRGREKEREGKRKRGGGGREREREGEGRQMRKVQTEEKVGDYYSK